MLLSVVANRVGMALLTLAGVAVVVFVLLRVVPGDPVAMTEEVWDRQIDFNLKTAFLGCKYAIPVMLEQGKGAIVNIASVAGMRNDFLSGRSHVGYSASKAGVIQLSRGKKTEALASLVAAARMESQRPRPIARPYPIKPAAELYGEALLETGDAAGAVKQFQASLARSPNRAASLIGLARAATAAKQPALAKRTAQTFLTMWKQSDQGRTEVKDARVILQP